MASVVFRRAQPQDYPTILGLQSKNFIANLSEEERKEGFLSAEFSREQVASWRKISARRLLLWTLKWWRSYARSVMNSITDRL